MITHLMEYQQEDGGFSHLTNLDKSQEMSTVQVQMCIRDRVMTVVPACESLEEIEAIERNRLRFEQFERCKSELERMKISL